MLQNYNLKKRVHMLREFDFAQFERLAAQSSRVCVYREIPADRLTPVSIVESLGEKMKDGAVLESADRHYDNGRYSFIAFGPVAEIRVIDGKVHLRVGEEQQESDLQPLQALRQLSAQMKPASDTEMFNGAIGFISYDAVRLFESIPDRHKNNYAFPEMMFRFYQNILTFDHQKQSLFINVTITTEGNLKKNYEQTQNYIDNLIKDIFKYAQVTQEETMGNIKENSNVSMDIDDNRFIELVEKAKEYIALGDAFQIVLSRKFSKSYTVSPFMIYRTLRRISPAPYMFYLPLENKVIIGASPEKLISVHEGEVFINPIAGTRSRSTHQEEDFNSKALLTDKKELAEHMMLVDLARNDLGAVCQPGSIKVVDFLKVKHFSHVSHITSVVNGRLRPDRDALDALAAAFPAGTLSGAPKIRAMEIIDELESSRRGLYGGAICRLDFQGGFDSCIAIRMAILADGLATVRTGAGIVHDSVPEKEAQETWQKAQGVLQAIAVAERE